MSQIIPVSVQFFVNGRQKGARSSMVCMTYLVCRIVYDISRKICSFRVITLVRPSIPFFNTAVPVSTDEVMMHLVPRVGYIIHSTTMNCSCSIIETKIVS